VLPSCLSHLDCFIVRMAAAQIALGTYIGSGENETGDECSITLKLSEKKMAWLDYKAVSKAKTDQYHADGAFVYADGGGAGGHGSLRFTYGGLPGQGRAGEVLNMSVQNIIEGNGKVITYQGVHLQPQHDTHAGEHEIELCAKCGEGIDSVGNSIKNAGSTYHKACFVCDKCSNPLIGAFSKTADGGKLCANCVPKRICATCGDAATGKITSVEGKFYHVECFVCFVCGEAVTGAFGFVGKDENKTIICTGCQDDKKEKRPPKEKKPPARPGTAAAAAAAATAAAPKAKVEAAPKADPPVVPEGTYAGKEDVGGEEIGYSVRFIEGFNCWVDRTCKTKIGQGSWHAEGKYTEEKEGGAVKTIKFTVVKNFGAGPKAGEKFDIAVEGSDTAPSALVFDGIKCAPLEGAVIADFVQVTDGKQESAAAKPAAPSSSPPAAKAPAPAPIAAEPAPKAASAPAPPPAAAGSPMTLDELKNSDACKAKGVDVAKKETYLSDADFSSLFGVTQEEFAKQPKWKRDGRKKEHGLY